MLSGVDKLDDDLIGHQRRAPFSPPNGKYSKPECDGLHPFREPDHVDDIVLNGVAEIDYQLGEHHGKSLLAPSHGRYDKPGGHKDLRSLIEPTGLVSITSNEGEDFGDEVRACDDIRLDDTKFSGVDDFDEEIREHHAPYDENVEEYFTSNSRLCPYGKLFDQKSQFALPYNLEHHYVDHYILINRYVIAQGPQYFVAERYVVPHYHDYERALPNHSQHHYVDPCGQKSEFPCQECQHVRPQGQEAHNCSVILNKTGSTGAAPDFQTAREVSRNSQLTDYSPAEVLQYEYVRLFDQRNKFVLQHGNHFQYVEAEDHEHQHVAPNAQKEHNDTVSPFVEEHRGIASYGQTPNNTAPCGHTNKYFPPNGLHYDPIRRLLERFGFVSPYSTQYQDARSADQKHQHVAPAEHKAHNLTATLNMKERSAQPCGQRPHYVAPGRHPDHPNEYFASDGMRYDPIRVLLETSGFVPPHSMQFQYAGPAGQEHQHVALVKQEAHKATASSDVKERSAEPDGENAHNVAQYRHLNEHFPPKNPQNQLAEVFQRYGFRIKHSVEIEYIGPYSSEHQRAAPYVEKYSDNAPGAHTPPDVPPHRDLSGHSQPKSLHNSFARVSYEYFLPQSPQFQYAGFRNGDAQLATPQAHEEYTVTLSPYTEKSTDVASNDRRHTYTDVAAA
ncbi:hypothetical protein KIN20_032389 [Parelaphostrongylus tenuis]|uniref:Uncharacterized protein n=1 Tax=Parelaphostrongylus tenuis TaxID=148309 RepID=A0AAD5R6U9_PARTN|nr:hypothetical protein KIN20_032389 [Parelaphostrongylus tenuis]